jgi:hypothetical protein
MQRTYLALTGLALAGAGLAAVAAAPLVRAAGLFESRPLDASRFAVLAKPVGDTDWNLLVLEQVQARPLCWENRNDGLVDPALNRFDFTGICSRYLDSNGYSLRVAEQDLASRYRLRVQQLGNQLQLQAFSPEDPTVLVVGRAELPRRDRDGFVALRLVEGWRLQRRAYGGQTLNHIYFSNGTGLGELQARAGGSPNGSNNKAPLRASRLMAASSELQGRGPALRPLPPSDPGIAQPTEAQAIAQPGRTIALQVIPFSE